MSKSNIRFIIHSLPHPYQANLLSQHNSNFDSENNMASWIILSSGGPQASYQLLLNPFFNPRATSCDINRYAQFNYNIKAKRSVLTGMYTCVHVQIQMTIVILRPKIIYLACDEPTQFTVYTHSRECTIESTPYPINLVQCISEIAARSTQ